MLPELDVEGQERLLQSAVLVVGMGGLGCPSALYLAAAGVGALVLADDDLVEMSNLQRQIAHTEADVGRSKVASAADSIRRINSETQLECLAERLTLDRLLELAGRVDVIVDASDNFATRFAVNQACVETGTSLVSGAAIRSEGQVAVFDTAAGSPCYQCLYPHGAEHGDEQLSCSESGVLAPIVGVIGSLQALETVKLLAGYGESLAGSMLVIDGWSLQVRRISLKRNPGCPCCSPAGVDAETP
jgi:molybdopterin/thiamine biosynthesis adenylyltransferase